MRVNIVNKDNILIYLILGSILLFLLVILLGKYSITGSGTIEQNDWTGKLHLASWKKVFSVEWHGQSDDYHTLLIRFFFMRIKKQINKKRFSERGKNSGRSGKKKSLFSKGKWNQWIKIKTLIVKLIGCIDFHLLSIDGHTSIWNPAFTGICYGLIQWLRSLPVFPMNIQIRPYFYPMKSHARCRIEMEFYLYRIVYVLIKEKLGGLQWSFKTW